MSRENANKKTSYDTVEAKDNMKREEKEDDILEQPEDKKNMEKVVKEGVTKKKKTLTSRFVKGVAGPDGFSGIGEYVKDEVVVPAVKNILLDTVSGAVGMVQDSIMSSINYKLFGDKAPPLRSSYNRRQGPAVGHRQEINHRTAYNTRPQTSHGTTNRQQPLETRRNTRERPLLLEDYILEDRDDAAHVITMMIEYADNYNQVSVADYYDLIGVTSVHTDYSYGWTLDEIHRTTMAPSGGGFVVSFPPALPL